MSDDNHMMKVFHDNDEFLISLSDKFKKKKIAFLFYFYFFFFTLIHTISIPSNFPDLHKQCRILNASPRFLKWT